MSTPLPITLLLFARTHAQLRYYFGLLNTDSAANESAVSAAVNSPAGANVVQIHPINRGALSAQRI